MRPWSNSTTNNCTEDNEMKNDLGMLITFQEADASKFTMVGGKGANLGELCKIDGIHVPEGFCISTDVLNRMMDETSSMKTFLDQLSRLKAEDSAKISELSHEIRRVIEGKPIPEDVIEEISGFLSKFGEEDPYAIRSSSTAEDLPSASFAGQQDTYLNIVGRKEILKHVSKCWASLFTERAITYRIQNGFDQRKVHLAVVVQKMVFPQVSGIMFTADPITSHRKILSIDASFGLGESVVSGLVNPDIYKVQEGKIIDKKISAKKVAILASKDGGTKEQLIAPEQQNKQALTDEQILQLEVIGRKIEEHFGFPQDIEWCLADDTSDSYRIYVVQSRPITTLYPVPKANDKENHVYISVGHQQMMTDAMKPLGWSLWQLMAARPMFEAGGRLFVDVTPDLASPARRQMFVNAMGNFDPLVKDALMTILARENFIKTSVDRNSGIANPAPPATNFQAQVDYDPTIVSDLMMSSQISIEELKENVEKKSGTSLLEFILEVIEKWKANLTDSRSLAVIMTAMNASTWINEKVKEWLGEKNAADTLSQSVPNNVTSEMGLELLEVADIIRPYPEIIEYLQHVKDDDFLDNLTQFEGGKKVQEAIHAYLHKYGMRCAGEIDITRTRWIEKPVKLVSSILSNINNVEPCAGRRKFEQGLQEALKKEHDILNRLRQLPDGEQKAKEAKQKIDLIRNFAGYREYPKYSIVCRYFIYKQALLKEAEQLVQAGIIHDKKDIYYLTFEEFLEVVSTHKLDYQLIIKRKEQHKFNKKLTPPRVITSDGETISGKYRRENHPTHAIVGLPVSSGIVEGRARVILRMEQANLQEGDILVTTFTDPSWTPLFVSIKGLITEVAGLMSHGAVIASEYRFPAVVGVENITRLIQDGQRIRVNGTDGYIEIL